MFRMMCAFWSCALLTTLAVGQPPDIKTGAQVVWDLVNLDGPEQFEKHFSDREVKERIHAQLVFDNIESAALKSIFAEKQRLSKSIRAADKKNMFNAVVTYCDSEIISIPIGNQYVLYQVETKGDDVMFIRLHLKGKRELFIDEIELVPINKAIPQICKMYSRMEMDQEEVP